MNETRSIVLIIGASRGLGRALANAYRERGWRVLVTVRDDVGETQLRADGFDEVHRLDVTDAPALARFGRDVAPVSLDLLIVNAGISGDVAAPAAAVSPEEWLDVMKVNALAPLVAIEALHPLIAEDGVIAAMSSILGSIALNDRGTWETYRMSKAALNMGIRSTAVRLGRPNQAFISIAPGWVRTDMGGAEAPLSIDESIPRVVTMLAAQAGIGGSRFVDYRGVELTW